MKDTILASITGLSLAFATLAFMHKPNCHTFQSVGNSHIRLNSCTGEAHMVYKDGKGGFEWVRVND